MSADVIISYDGTPNDDDALSLGKMLARAGATLALAYVRHSREFDPRREALAQHGGELGQLLASALAYESGDVQALAHCGIDAALLRDAYWQAIEQAKATLRDLAVLRA